MSPDDDGQVPTTPEGEVAVPEPDPDHPAAFSDDRPPVPPGPQAGGGDQLAGVFLTRAFFLSLHERAGDPDGHPTRAWICFYMDFALRLVAALVILTIAVVAAWKALAPLPWS